MKLITTVPIPDVENPIDYHSRIVMLGSCFTENIGAQLSNAGFHTLINPFGILFNPVSIATLVHKACNRELFTNDDVENTFSYYAHSVINGEDAATTLERLNAAQQQLKAGVEDASHVIITLGSAWVYRHKTRGMVVANCHKQPQQLFNKELLSSQQIIPALLNIVSDIKKINANCQVIFTLSPVRHFKDGVIENTRSKARLHDGIQHVIDRQKAFYFPSYEIVMDEMRDYRFYAKDLLHLNELGIEYVWLRFRESVINNNTLPIQKKVMKYRNLLAHRPTDATKHKNQLHAMRNELLISHPEIKLS
jgi:lysophospholipase L1-like esterase